MSMLRVTENDELERWVADSAAQALENRRLAVPDAATALRVIPHLSARFAGAISAVVPFAPDQVERLLIDIASQVGDEEVLRLVDGALTAPGDDLEQALAPLREALGSRTVILDGRPLGAVGNSPELARALLPRIRNVESWLRGLPRLLVVSVTPSAKVLPAAPLALANGTQQPPEALWNECGHRIEPFSLVLAKRALTGAPQGAVAEAPWDEDQLRAEITAALPTSWCRAHAMLAVHARPLGPKIVEGLGLTSALEHLATFSLCHRLATGWRVDEGWSRWWRSSLPRRERAGYSLDLAEVFSRQVRPGEKNAWREGLALLEANRHLTAAGQWRRALEFARYGVAILVEYARARSVSGDYEAAAEIYEAVVSALEQNRTPVVKRVLGYSRHYLHFNRARSHAEPIEATVDGYREAVEEWPENALFWSRLSRAEFYREHQADGLHLLERAQHLVPPHSEKQTVLVARSARGLLKRGHLTDAILVWGDYVPDTPLALEIAEQLDAATSKGWSVDRIVARDVAIHFTRPLRVQIEPFPKGYRASIPELDAQGAVAGSRVGALRSLVSILRDEVKRCVAAYTHHLSEREQARKQKLLGAVDILASALVDARDTAWVFGDLKSDQEGRLWLETGGNTGLVFEVPGSLVEGRTLGEQLWFAEVACRPPGVPVGPVQKLEPVASHEDVWTAWANRMRDGQG